MIKVLFVCLGNICRSPLAEGIFKHYVIKEGLESKIACDSAGTSSYHLGENPDSRTIRNARKNGIELDHKARQFKYSDFENFDYILAMDNSNLQNVLKLKPASDDKSKIFLMRDFDDEAEGYKEVPDPYFGGDEGFQEVFEILERSNRNFLNHLIEKHGLS